MKTCWKRLNYMMFFGMLLCICVACIVVCRWEPSYQIENYSNQFLKLNKWKLETEDGFKEISLPKSLMQHKAGREIRLSIQLPEQSIQVENPVLLLNIDHCDTVLYLDDTEIYRREVGDDRISKTEGYVLLFIELPEDWQGKKLTISYTALLSRTAFYYMQTPLLGEKADILIYKLKTNLPSIVIDCILLFAGIVLLVFHLSGKMWQKYNYNFFMIALFSIFSSIYLIAGSDWARLFVKNQYILYILQYSFLMLLITPILLFVKDNLKYARMMGFVHFIMLASIVNFYFMYGLNFLFGYDFKFLVIITHGLILAGALSLIFVLGSVNKKKNVVQQEEVISLLAPAITGVLNIVVYYQGQRDVGMFIFRIGILTYVVLQFYYNCKRAMNLMQEKYKMELYRNMAYHDALTGLRNRAAYECDLKKIPEENTHMNQSIHVFSVDVNNLKEVNDKQGHRAGDTLIIQAASILKRGVAEWGDVYRTGGDEFVVFLRGCTEKQIAEIEENIKQECISFNEQKDLQVSFALGKASFDKKQDTVLEETVARADLAMYEEKKRYKQSKQQAENR